MAEQVVDKVKGGIDRRKTAIGMLVVGVVAAAALLKQKQQRAAAKRES